MNNSGFPRLRQLRKDLSMTQEAFAESIGISKTTYNNYETGAREPRSDFWERVSKKYKVTVDFLLGLSNEKHYSTEMKNSPTPVQAETGDLTPDKRELLFDYDLLNEYGKEAARNSIHGLTSIPDYKKSSESKFLEENA